ncbi:hypothetical protein VNO80_00929 [Phaseolus coccineus]|uniref:Uncharacterized protein n=1 Tax=Phaseolus coccineus TaxID=3886 RepID=A0AAN9P4D6_PHACN
MDNVRPLKFSREMHATSTIQNSSSIITDKNIAVLERGCNFVKPPWKSLLEVLAEGGWYRQGKTLVRCGRDDVQKQGLVVLGMKN